MVWQLDNISKNQVIGVKSIWNSEETPHNDIANLIWYLKTSTVGLSESSGLIFLYLHSFTPKTRRQSWPVFFSGGGGGREG